MNNLKKWILALSLSVMSFGAMAGALVGGEDSSSQAGSPGRPEIVIPPELQAILDAPPAAQTSADQSCGSILCLVGLAMGEESDECDAFLDAFFDIRAFKKKKFRPFKTLVARMNFLNQCKESPGLPIFPIAEEDEEPEQEFDEEGKPIPLPPQNISEAKSQISSKFGTSFSRP
jgi:hypothetical protein